MTTALNLLSPEAKEFALKPCLHFIDGKMRTSVSKKTNDILDPSDGKKITVAAQAGQEEIDDAIASARKAFKNSEWSYMSPSQRGKILWRIGDLIDEHGDILGQLESLDNGKPYKLARFGDITRASETFRYYAGWASKLDGRYINIAHAGMNTFNASVRHEAIGVVGQIIPWNVPLVMAAWKLAPALAVGCTSVLKPAEQTPLTATYLAQILQKAGLPEGVVNIVHGDGYSGSLLSEHSGIDKIAFTGSAEVGKLVVKAASTNLKKVSLELGGKSPHIIFADADLETAIPAAARAIFSNCGQACSAGSRLFIERSVFDQVVEGVVSIAKKLHIGPGMALGSELGPLISAAQLKTVRGYIDQGVKEGAYALCGLEAYESEGYFVRPVVFVNTKKEMTIRREEIFGPVLCAQAFDDEEEMLSEANNTHYGLAAGVWTNDLSKAHRISTALRAGSVYVNCYQVSDVNMPFGGYKQSGWGRELGPDALSLYTETKSVCMALSK
ncbi:MAG: aldehyde dehydrogenase family protein [Myxococcales bacterium]|nr:aldehyde dehydrogenase family protein [Myxococcales bacterium]USN51135.1 MAG: aldehyde dehydrogenase family protein [Myxococcales bacterium]